MFDVLPLCMCCLQPRQAPSQAQTLLLAYQWEQSCPSRQAVGGFPGVFTRVSTSDKA